ncbi:hypothetical protein A5N78_04650 [Prescottella equi]|uniref:hypothetical protein n=1 Tax=Rhodococcus hoagii TaxID=43767 RepID=UPI000A104666|nr:hypothetical protein [Prescottella equi]ORL93429.1 hypothetical protein A5N78_04650 [Prescottella equi]ORM17782.1 hypothetical protein A5N70_11225 [Prescottella equi]
MSHGLELARARHNAGLTGVKVSIHSADVGLPKLFDVHLDPRDGAGVETKTRSITGVECCSIGLTLGAGTPSAARLMALDPSDAVFLRVEKGGETTWARLQRWSSDPRLLTATFGQAYQSLRYSSERGFHTDTLVEPSPPVPFDESHPHYPGSAVQEMAERSRHVEELRLGREH